VTPGSYTLAARLADTGRGRGAGPSTPSALFGLVDVTVLDGRDAEVSIPIHAGVTISGRVVFAGASPAPSNLASISVGMRTVQTGNSAAIGVASVHPDPRGVFTLTGVAPGRYLFGDTTAALGTWQLASATVQDREALDVPFDVTTDDLDGVVLTYTDHPTELTGRLLDASGRPAPEYIVIVFAADKTFWTPRSRRIQQVRPGIDGKFIVKNLPPGEYLIGTVTDVEPGEWFDPTFLQQLVPVSVKVALAEGDKKVQDVKISK
jgi:hypothetical protein